MRTVSVRTVLFGLAASTAALLLSACGSDAEGTIVIYTGRHYDLETAFNAFEDEFNIDIEFLEGKEWRIVKKTIKECEQGIDQPDSAGLRIQYIERVERWKDQHGEYIDGDDDYETIWEREGEM